MTAQLMVEAMSLVPSMPDVLAIGGWHKYIPGLYSDVGAGYLGIEAGRTEPGMLFGTPVTLFTSTHERSHIMMAAGMHPVGSLGGVHRSCGRGRSAPSTTGTPLQA